MVAVRDILAPPNPPPVVGAFWDIPPQNVPRNVPQPQTPDSTRLAGNYEESVIDTDNRKPVGAADYRDGGKYRSIVKIRAQYEGSDPSLHWIGTGYLIRDDLLVTAGHVVFERDAGKTAIGHGRAVSIECFIGYHGLSSVGTDSDVQQRFATRVITTRQWVMDGNKRYDCALVQVGQPFTGTLGFMDLLTTPAVGQNELLGIVGYPGDQTLRVTPHGEDGAIMHEMFRRTSWNLHDDRDHMLHYTIATGGGQSGAPVLLQGHDGELSILGTHCYGDARGVSNSASVNEGRYGNLLGILEESVDSPDKMRVRDIGFNLIALGSCCRVNAWKRSQDRAEAALESSNDDFLGILKAIGRVVTPIAQTTLPIVSPLFGPLGGPIAAIGGVALDALSDVVAESGLEGTVGAPTGGKRPENAYAQRAVLAEAALQTVLRMERSPVSQKILDDMQANYRRTGFTQIKAARLGQKLVPIFNQAGLKFAVNETFLTAKSDLVSRKVMHRSNTESNLAAATDDGRDIEGFLHAISAHEINIFRFSTPHPTDREAQPESITMDYLWNFVCKGARAVKPVIIGAARTQAYACYQMLDSWLAKQLDPVESAESSIVHDRIPAGRKVMITDEEAAALLVTRAVMAGCALQAVLKADKEELSESHILGDASSVEPESFFDSMLKTVQKIGPAVENHTQTVTRYSLPPMIKALRAHIKVNGVEERTRGSGGSVSPRSNSTNGRTNLNGGQDRSKPIWENGMRPRSISSRGSGSNHQVSIHLPFS
ncbi:hypothetical protein QBC45DRAFT_336641 [Copromyces sp. CBS 386.78]|nr:hypothetical protein QBC45DRAFT_336641 [Copromyces sp. CBS 386.78]